MPPQKNIPKIRINLSMDPDLHLAGTDRANELFGNKGFSEYVSSLIARDLLSCGKAKDDVHAVKRELARHQLAQQTSLSQQPKPRTKR